MKIWSFRALDTLFFRDGTPFRQGEGGNVQPVGRFPPLMSTLQGAIRTTLARRQGWSPNDKGGLPAGLGSSKDLGVLRLRGPYLRYRGERLYPAPHLFFGKKGEPPVRLVLGEEVECDMGLVRLPKLEKKRVGKRLSGWLTAAGLEAALAGGIPPTETFFQAGDLWEPEHRVGIGWDCKTRTAKEGELYGAIHTRPKSELQIEVEVDGIPEDRHPEGSFGVSLGGEGRIAHVTVTEGRSEPRDRLPSPSLTPEGDLLRFTVSLLTPGSYPNPCQVIREGLAEIPGRCVSASIDKVLQVGGWDLEKRRPRPLTSLLPPGSTWFYEAKREELDQIKELHGRLTGNQQAYGMGEVVIGTWREGTK